MILAAGRRVVIGVGNPFRGDDGVGTAVAERVRQRGPVGGHGVEVTCLDGEPARIVEVWDGAGLAVVVDATRSGTVAGTIARIEVDLAGGDDDHHDDGLPAGTFAGGTHGAGVGEAAALGRALGRCPRRLVVFGVEGAHFGPGPGLSPPVEAALDTVAALVARELSW
jgi:hydrogenase maturation protease